jgi:hypothetical protein
MYSQIFTLLCSCVLSRKLTYLGNKRKTCSNRIDSRSSTSEITPPSQTTATVCTVDYVFRHAESEIVRLYCVTPLLKNATVYILYAVFCRHIHDGWLSAVVLILVVGLLSLLRQSTILPCPTLALVPVKR